MELERFGALLTHLISILAQPGFPSQTVFACFDRSSVFKNEAGARVLGLCFLVMYEAIMV